MDFFAVLCGVLIMGGALIIGLSILQTRLIFRRLEEQRYRLFWQLLTLLMGTFVFGYLVAFFLVFKPDLRLLTLLLATVFGLGAVFVFLTVYISRLTIEHLYQLKETLRRESLHDPLTELPNRRLLNERLEKCLARYRRLQDYADEHIYFAVLLLDLDDFKQVNDTLGHQAGDQLLVEVGRRIQECIRTCDTLARLGGDEFCILLEDLIASTQSITIVERILSCFESPFEINQQQLQITCSIGISSVTSGRRNTVQEIFQQADLALYRAKSQGKNRYSSFG